VEQPPMYPRRKRVRRLGKSFWFSKEGGNPGRADVVFGGGSGGANLLCPMEQKNADHVPDRLGGGQEKGKMLLISGRSERNTRRRRNDKSNGI